LLEGSNGEVASYGGEVVEELIERVPSLEIIEQRLERHPRSNEHRLAAEDLRIGVHCGLLSTHGGVAISKRSSRKIMDAGVDA